MDSIDRHATHNQKSHANRLGRPSNVGGKTGLAKATAALADKPELGPERPPAEPKRLTATEIEQAIGDPERWYMGKSRKIENHLALLEQAGASREQAREIIKDLGGNPDNEWQMFDPAAALHYRAEREAKDAKLAEQRSRLAAATPGAYARLLGTDGGEPLVKSRPVRAVFEAMQGSGWVMSGATRHGGFTFSSPDGERVINVLTINGVTIYDARHNKISGVKALAYVGGR